MPLRSLRLSIRARLTLAIVTVACVPCAVAAGLPPADPAGGAGPTAARIALLAGTAGFAALLARRVHGMVTQPLMELTAAARAVSVQRNYSARATPRGGDELGALAVAFNDMMAEIERRDRELREHRAELEAGIAARTADLRSANVDLRRAVDRAEATARAKSEFLAHVSHELRTPMNAVLGMTGLALETDLTAEQRDYLTTAQASAESLLEVLDDVLDIAKVEAGKLDLSPGDVDLRALVGDIVKPLSVRADAKGLELVGLVAAAVPPRLVLDAGRLRQVLINLVGNALKFTPQGDVVLAVRARDHAADAVTLEFSVRDTGIGMTPEQQALVFQAYAQADATITRRFGGTGLGLAISSRLVALMGGALTVTSAPGAGSTFAFTIRAALPVGEERPAAPSWPAGLRALVVDEHHDARAALAEALHALGCASLPVAPPAATGVDCDVAFVAVRGDRDAAYAAAAQLRARAPAPAVFLAVPWSAQHEGHVRAAALGLQGLVTRPLRHTDLAERLARTFAPKEVPASVPAAPAPAALVRRLRVLIAEDNPVNRRLAETLMTRAGHDVATAEDGRRCLEQVERAPFDVILMDVQMPELDGLEATRRIRARERERGGHVAIVALTANALPGAAQACQAAGMDDYVSKPIRTDQLHQAIARALARSQPAPVG